MKSVSIETKDQNKLKIISKVLNVLSNIGRVFIFIGMFSLIICMIMVPTFIKHTKAYDDKIVFKYSGEKLSIVKEDSEKISFYINDKKESKSDDIYFFNYVRDVLLNHSNNELIGIAEAVILLVILYLYLISLILKHLSGLFKNINNEDTPFTLDNISHLNKMSIYMVFAFVLPIISSNLFALFTDLSFNFRFSIIDVIQILFVISISIIFKYGYELQSNSKKKIYDDNE